MSTESRLTPGSRSLESSDNEAHHIKRDGDVTEKEVTGGGGQLDEAQIAKSGGIGGISSVSGRGVRDCGCASRALVVRHSGRS